MSKQNRFTKQTLLAVILIFVILFLFIELKDGKPQWRSGTGFEEGKTITTSIEKAPNGKIIKTVTTEKPEPGKTLWDLLQLTGTLAVPLVIAFLGFRFQEQQQQRANEQTEREKRVATARAERESQLAYEIKMFESERAEINLREEALQNYFDRIAEVLIDKKLLALADKFSSVGSQGLDQPNEDREDKTVVLASLKLTRVWTLSILRRLSNDKERKRSVIQFLVDAEIVGKLALSLANADLSQADLCDVVLSGVNLNGANLSGAVLSKANLSNAKLIDANLTAATLTGANLNNANLTKASLLPSRYKIGQSKREQ